MGRSFGHHRTFQLATHQESSHEPKRLTLQRRGHIAFNADADFEKLTQLLKDGWKIQTSVLSKAYTFAKLKQRFGKPGADWLIVAAVTPDGNFRLYSSEQTFTAEPGWNVFYFAPEDKREGKALARDSVKVPATEAALHRP